MVGPRSRQLEFLLTIYGAPCMRRSRCLSLDIKIISFSTITSMSPLSPLYRPKNPLTMTIFVIPPTILALETFDWSDFPVVQRDPLYSGVAVHLLRHDGGNESCSSHKNDESNQKALHSMSHDHESLPELSSLGSDESDVSVTNTLSTSVDDEAVTTYSTTNNNNNTDNKRAVTFADHVQVFVVLFTHKLIL